MEYHALSAAQIPAWIATRPALQPLFAAGESMQVAEVGDGNLNMVFIVRGQGSAVVVKQALPYLRVVGESWPLTRERMRYETQALHEYGRLVPGRVPVVLDEEADLSLVVMELLDGYDMLRHALVARKRFPFLAEHLGTFLARTLFFTSDLYLSGEEKKAMQAQYVNADLRRLQEDFVYTNPFAEMEENKWNPAISEAVHAIRGDWELKLALAEAKRAYMQHAEALIHADLHTGSVMVTATDTRVIDPEFAFFGPMAYDVAALVQNLVLNWLSHWAHTPDADERRAYRRWLTDTIHALWARFAETFEALWKDNHRGELVPARYWAFPGGDDAFAAYRAAYMARLLQQVALHGGAKLLRRTMGIVSVWDFTCIADPAVRAVPERAAIGIGRRWAIEHARMRTIGDLMDIVEEEAGRVEGA